MNEFLSLKLNKAEFIPLYLHPVLLIGASSAHYQRFVIVIHEMSNLLKYLAGWIIKARPNLTMWESAKATFHRGEGGFCPICRRETLIFAFLVLGGVN